MKNKNIIKLIVTATGVLAVTACNSIGGTTTTSFSSNFVSSSSKESGGSSSSSSSSIPDNHALRFELSEDGTFFSVFSLNVVETRDRVIIPSTYNGKPVTTIGERAFQYCKYMTQVVIPDSITTICDYAFSYSHIESFTFSENIKTVGDYAFESTRLTAVTIPYTITNFGSYVFESCFSLRSATIAEGFESTGHATFMYCKNLTELNLPNSVKTIGNRSLAGSGFVDLVIPNTIETIEMDAFLGTESLKSVVVPNSVKTIGDTAFGGCRNLETVSIANSVTEIGPCAFSSCFNLKTITLSNEIKTIGSYFFHECDIMKSIIIPNKVETIGWRAFEKCRKLETVIMPISVKNIDVAAFNECFVLNLYYLGTSIDWNKITMTRTESETEDSDWLDKVYFYSEARPTSEGQYWHYVDGVPSKWSSNN